MYVDKTSLICDLLDSSYKVTLLCRPRRFGKSLAMRMLQCFFETPVKASRSEGLEKIEKKIADRKKKIEKAVAEEESQSKTKSSDGRD